MCMRVCVGKHVPRDYKRNTLEIGRVHVCGSQLGFFAPLQLEWVSGRIIHFSYKRFVYSPLSAPHASPRPGLIGKTSASMILVAGPPVPTSEVAFRALRALIEASVVTVGTAAHRGDTERATAASTA